LERWSDGEFRLRKHLEHRVSHDVRGRVPQAVEPLFLRHLRQHHRSPPNEKARLRPLRDGRRAPWFHPRSMIAVFSPQLCGDAIILVRPLTQPCGAVYLPCLAVSDAPAFAVRLTGGLHSVVAGARTDRALSSPTTDCY